MFHRSKFLAIASIFSLTLAILFFGIHCGPIVGALGVIFSVFLYIFSFWLVDKLFALVDLSMAKMAQPFYLGIFAISIMFNKTNDYSLLVISVGVFFTLNLLIFHELKIQKFFRDNFLSKLLNASAVFLLSVAGYFIISFYGSSLNKYITSTELFQIFYFLNLVIFFLLDNYKIELPKSKLLYAREYLIIKITASIVIIGKILLLLNFLRDSFLFEVTYIASAFVLLMSFREKKEYFILIALLFSALAFIPGRFTVLYLDPSIIAFLATIPYFRSPVLMRRKSRYGELIVNFKYISKVKMLLNNGVIHGVEPLSYNGGACVHPYYTGVYRKGSFLRVLELYKNRNKKIAVLGMGVGMIASLIKQGDKMTFYEIDPDVKDIAVNSGLFSYIRKSLGNVDIKMGHARKELEKSKEKYDLIVVDTYLGKKVVSEFLTTEAFEEYFEKLQSDGIVAIHLTSGLENHEAVLASLCSKLGLSGLISYRSTDDREYKEPIVIHINTTPPGVSKYHIIRSLKDYLTNKVLYDPYSLSRGDCVVWAIFSRSSKNFGDIMLDPRWHKLRGKHNVSFVSDEKIQYSKDVVITDVIE